MTRSRSRSSRPGAMLTGFSLRHVLREDDSLFLRYEVDRDA